MGEHIFSDDSLARLFERYPELRTAIERGATFTASVQRDDTVERLADDVSRAVARLLMRVGPRHGEGGR